MKRKRLVCITKFLRSCCAATILSVATTAHADFTDQFTPTGLEVEVSVFAEVPPRSTGQTARLNSIAITGSRIFVVESYDGIIYEITDGAVSVWFDIKSALGSLFDNSDFVEGGLRSVAFHPEFSSNGKFYTSQDQKKPGQNAQVPYLSGASDPGPTDSVVTEWTQFSDGSFSAHRELVRIGQPGSHSIKQIGFNPNPHHGDYGLLYIAHADGASIEVGFSDPRPTALGKILRIDPDPSAQRAYSLPVNNPFLGDDTLLDEVFALGFRNPHNFSFDRSGRLFVADIGSGNVEEINIVDAGGDYGWGNREGSFRYISTDRGTGVAPLPQDDARFGYIYPAASFRHEVTHNGGLAVAGGYAVENDSPLAGNYFFAEFSSTGELLYSTLSGLNSATTRGNPETLSQATVYQPVILFNHDSDDSTPSVQKQSLLEVFNDSPHYDSTSNRADVRLGQGPEGEIYITSKRNNTIYVVENSFASNVGGGTDAADHQNNGSSCVDPDGDGWGWDGSASCRVSEEPVIPSEAVCIDTDGDGWGWDGTASCRITTSVSDDEQSLCVDTDGDGWGWDGTSSCRVSVGNNTVQDLCVDSDGDGWGWNGTDSCVIF